MKNLSSTHHLLALALTTLMSAGCDEAQPGEAEAFGAGEVSERCVSCGGIKFNTFEWGKQAGGSLDINNQVWENARLVSVELLCNKDSKQAWRYPKECSKNPTAMFKLDRAWADAGELHGYMGTYNFRGADFVQSRWTIDLYTDGKLTGKNVQKITDYSFDPVQKPHPLHYYTFLFFGDGANGGEKGVWTPACKEDKDPITGAPVGTRALVYDDIQVDTVSGKISKRADALYIACISAAVGKAGNWGYPEWQIGYEDFTTAVRTVRADYCGDGESWTTKGNALQVTDVWGYSDFGNAGAVNEAMWSEQGALCLGNPRWTNMVKYTDVVCNGALLQPCKDSKISDYPEATLWTKLP